MDNTNFNGKPPPSTTLQKVWLTVFIASVVSFLTRLGTVLSNADSLTCDDVFWLTTCSILYALLFFRLFVGCNNYVDKLHQFCTGSLPTSAKWYLRQKSTIGPVLLILVASSTFILTFVIDHTLYFITMTCVTILINIIWLFYHSLCTTAEIDLITTRFLGDENQGFTKDGFIKRIKSMFLLNQMSSVWLINNILFVFFCIPLLVLSYFLESDWLTLLMTLLVLINSLCDLYFTNTFYFLPTNHIAN